MQAPALGQYEALVGAGVADDLDEITLGQVEDGDRPPGTTKPPSRRLSRIISSRVFAEEFIGTVFDGEYVNAALFPIVDHWLFLTLLWHILCHIMEGCKIPMPLETLTRTSGSGLWQPG